MRPSTTLKLSTIVFLVLLRLAIGWHFTFEAREKLTSDTWSSDAYLRGAVGPLAPEFRWMAGDPLLDKMTPRTVADTTKAPLHDQLPGALDRDWRAYFDRFAAHYQLTPEQRTQAEAKLLQAEDDTANFLLNEKKPVTWTSPYGPPVVSEKTVAERIRLYQDQLKEALEVETRELPRNSRTLFEKDVNGRLATLKADAARTRAGLRGDLDAQTRKMQESLTDVLTPVQETKGPLPAALPVPALASPARLELIDASVRWGLLVVGVCLLLGAFTRPASVLGAAFLLLFYLAMPPLLGVPENPKAEGHYLLINKNIIEMLALLALATVPSGRWFGVDGLLQFLNPWNYRRRPESESVPAPGTNGPTGRPAPVTLNN
jgi:uncharacterized membrane protein YphA (DoxX/SURF4 family)